MAKRITEEEKKCNTSTWQSAYSHHPDSGFVGETARRDTIHNQLETHQA